MSVCIQRQAMKRAQINKLDKEFSLRIRAKGKCERCGKLHDADA